MSWGTQFKADIFISRKTYSGIEEVNEYIIDREKYLDELKTKLCMLASSNIRDIVPEEWKEQPIDWIKNEIDSLMEIYDEEIRLLDKLYMYNEYLKEKNGNNS